VQYDSSPHDESKGGFGAGEYWLIWDINFDEMDAVAAGVSTLNLLGIPPRARIVDVFVHLVTALNNGGTEDVNNTIITDGTTATTVILDASIANTPGLFVASLLYDVATKTMPVYYALPSKMTIELASDADAAFTAGRIVAGVKLIGYHE
jgi:hypothetical protein